MVTVQIVCDKPLRLSNERWIRIPQKGYCEWCGLSRSHLYALVVDEKVRSVSLKKPGNQRGPRLVWLPSVFAYIEREGEFHGLDGAEDKVQDYSISMEGMEGL